MKRIFLLLCVILLCGCAGNDKSAKTASSVTAVPEISAAQETETPVPEETAQGTEPSENSALSTAVDVDLTSFSSTAVYSTVYNMIVEPDSFIGQTVRMKGEFASFYDETKDRWYFGCIVKDALACCAQGLEFELTDEYVWPDDYPEDGQEITVIGTFDIYTENYGDHTVICSYLKDAQLIRE